MGNVTFLRKRKEWSNRPKNEASIKDLKNIYAEYFTTLRQALDMIDNSLKNIKKNLDLSWITSPKLLPHICHKPLFQTAKSVDKQDIPGLALYSGE